MTWIDERLFGWSRSAKHGTSVWGGSTEDPGTPDGTDEEDAGDYENVVGIIPVCEDQPNVAYKPRSRQSSYADLQRLRASGLSPPVASKSLSASNSSVSSAFEMDGLQFSSSHRDRKASLTSGVPVRRIAKLDPQEPFADATHDLNDEIRRKES